MDAKQKIEDIRNQDWIAYAKRAGLLDADGVANCSMSAQTAYYAYAAAWNTAHSRLSDAAQTLASKEAELVRMRAELGNIVKAERFNKEHFTSDTDFASWAVSRANHALTQPTE